MSLPRPRWAEMDAEARLVGRRRPMSSPSSWRRRRPGRHRRRLRLRPRPVPARRRRRRPAAARRRSSTASTCAPPRRSRSSPRATARRRSATRCGKELSTQAVGPKLAVAAPPRARRVGAREAVVLRRTPSSWRGSPASTCSTTTPPASATRSTTWAPATGPTTGPHEIAPGLELPAARVAGRGRRRGDRAGGRGGRACGRGRRSARAPSTPGPRRSAPASGRAATSC